MQNFFILFSLFLNMLNLFLILILFGGVEYIDNDDENK